MKKSITRLAICTIGLGLLISTGCATVPSSPNKTAVSEPPMVTETAPVVTEPPMATQTAPVITEPPVATHETPAVTEAPPTATTVAKTVPYIYEYTPDASQSLGTEKQLSEFCREIAGKVYYELKQDGDKHLTARVAVVDAVPLSDLKRETEFGRLISEYMLTDLADRGLKVTELRMGKEINILPQTGEFILSRNIGELATDSPMLDYVLVSTFTNTRKTLILQGRLVGLKSGLVETSWRYTLPLNRELLGLFHAPEQPFTIAVNGMSH